MATRLSRDEKKALALMAGAAVLLILRRASAAAPPKGSVVIGPVTETTVATTPEQRTAMMRLGLAVDRAKKFTAFDDDLGPQKRPSDSELSEIAESIKLWKQIAQTAPELIDQSPDLLERIYRVSSAMPADNSLVDAASALRRSVGYDAQTFSPTKAPTGSALAAAQRAVALWRRYSEVGADYLQLLLDDALALRNT